MHALYESAFPEDSEREPKEVWENALAAGNDVPYRLEFIVAEAGSEIAGGISLEYYPQSGCGLLTFLFVAEGFRDRGVARSLVSRALARLHDLGGGRLRFVFAEAEHPSAVASRDVKSSMDPTLRLQILRRLGARLVRIDYVQPALGPGQRPAEHLLLLLLAPPDTEFIHRRDLRAFLLEFYGSLDVRGAAADQLLRRALGDPAASAPVPVVTLE